MPPDPVEDETYIKVLPSIWRDLLLAAGQAEDWAYILILDNLNKKV
jgi:hypothetical protein